MPDIIIICVKRCTFLLWIVYLYNIIAYNIRPSESDIDDDNNNNNTSKCTSRCCRVGVLYIYIILCALHKCITSQVMHLRVMITGRTVMRSQRRRILACGSPPSRFRYRLQAAGTYLCTCTNRIEWGCTRDCFFHSRFAAFFFILIMYAF